MEIIILLLASCAILELLTLRNQLLLVYLDLEKVNTIIKKNWKLLLLYGVVAAIASPITMISILMGYRKAWELKLYNSIINNLYIREKA